MNVSLGTFTTTRAMRANIKRVLDTGRLSYGPFCRELESRVAQMHDCRHGILSNSGTDSLRIALLALKIRYDWPDGAEVIVPAITFVATINVILQCGLRPHLVDVDEYFHIDARLIPRAIRPDTVAILPVHLFGQMADMRAITHVARQNGLVVLEDSCEAIGVSQRYEDEVIYPGSSSHGACFSTYMAHVLTTGVGGLTVTNDRDIATLCRSLTNHGRNADYLSIDDDDDDPESVFDKRFDFRYVGYSARITELEAAIGVAQLQELEQQIALRRLYSEELAERLSAYDELHVPRTRPGNVNCHMMFPLLYDGARRDLFLRHLERNGIETRYAMPITTQSAYAGEGFTINAAARLPRADHVNRHGLYIGSHHELTSEHARYVASVVESFYAR